MIKTAITVSLVEEARGGPFVLWDGVEKGCETAAEVAKVRKATASRSDFYLIPDIMKEHPIKGWEKWKASAAPVQSFE